MITIALLDTQVITHLDVFNRVIVGYKTSKADKYRRTFKPLNQ